MSCQGINMYRLYQCSFKSFCWIFVSFDVICVYVLIFSISIPGFCVQNTTEVEYDNSSVSPYPEYTEQMNWQQRSCAEGWTLIHSSCYKLIWHRGIAGFFHFLEAADECMVAGGIVASLPTQHVEHRVLSMIRKQVAEYPHFRLTKIYIGLNDLITEDTFSWFDGSPSYYHNWGVDEPNNQEHEEDCVSLYSEDELWQANKKTTWSDYPCCTPSNIKAVLCQREPNLSGMKQQLSNKSKELVRALEVQCYGHEKNECNSSPCYNGGRCEDDVRGFKCICTPGHYGELCQFDIQCPAPQYYQNTLRSYNRDHRQYYYQTEVTYMCKEGYIFQNSTDEIGIIIIRCNESGEWYPQETIPLCEAISCKPFPIWSGYQILKSIDDKDNERIKKKQYSYGLTVNYTCKEGFQLASGHFFETTRCNIHGNWTPQLVNCTESPLEDDPKAVEALKKFRTPVEATAAEAVGTVGLIFMLIELSLLILIDFDTLSLHLYILFSNIVGFCFRQNYTTQRPSSTRRSKSRRNNPSVRASRNSYTYDSVPKETEYQAETVL